MFSRRSFLAGAVAASLVPGACTRRKARGFSGYAFVANQEGRAVAAVDLTVFAVAKHIPINGAPNAIAAFGSRVYALTPDSDSIYQIDSEKLVVSGVKYVGPNAVQMRVDPVEKAIYVLCRAPNRLVRVALPDLRLEWDLPLPYAPVNCDLTRDGKTIAISYGAQGAISFVDASQRKIFEPVHTGDEVGELRFQADSTQLIVTGLSRRMLSIYQTATRMPVVNLPLTVRPERLCFNADGGQLFITGEGMDGIVVVYPYDTEVAETVLAGHAPGAMAASAGPDDGYLFVANGASGDVSILDIRTHKLLAVTPVGTNPSYVTITPDNQYALVLNETSGDMAVIRIPNITRTVNEQRRWKKGALFMLIPIGSKPVSAAVVAI